MVTNESQGLPPFLLNTIPKSGTHLVKQMLRGIPGMNHHPDKGMFGHIQYQTSIQLERIKDLTNNEFVNGHLFYSTEWETFFKELSMKQIFVYRDPRDVIVSYAYFIPALKIHPLYDTFKQEGFTHRDRIKFLIKGGQPTDPKKAYQPDVLEWYKSFSTWIGKDNVHPVRFEDLISSDTSRLQATHRIVKFLWGDLSMPSSRQEMVGKMIQNIDPGTSPTFRKGKIGGWKDEMDGELRSTFKKVAGPLLIELGYEKNLDW
ncbi:sulfotransferase domain-containing protein [Pseudalkalibacillus salsuginis]|uniref:sulfotransferase domain-containing protein n=1 Tax=Pseudalkalibacillus salsuginis TaxID=2910972 RepID=UPI001F2E6912|nr:sulfotransferase domain-containing protein [Pseudalkalibacillus salsuginis]MCF6409158.1 sulfotransferase domain-containing protein [Pseudalkalibacillus salsuginis]